MSEKRYQRLVPRKDEPTTYMLGDLVLAREPECVQCGARRKRGEFGKWWPTGAWSCRLCFQADFG